MIGRLAFLLVCVFVTVAPAGERVARAASPVLGEVVMDGTARLDVYTRPVRFHFLCSANGPNVTGVLSVSLEALDFKAFQLIFDFLPFEGPDSTAGALSVLRSSGTGGAGRDRFKASGSIVPARPKESFSLEVTASRLDHGPLGQLAAVLRPLTEGPSQLIWTQESPKSGAQPLTATVDLSKTKAEQLKIGLGSCLDQH